MSATLDFSYGATRLRNIRITETRQGRKGGRVATELEVDDRRVQPTRRFWKSFFHRFGINDNVFRYFTPTEVFERVSQESKEDRLQYCLQHGTHGTQMLAVTSPNRPIIDHGKISELVRRHDGRETGYANGIVTSDHAPRSGFVPIQIGADMFRKRFVLDTPIDGFGSPKLHLSLMREICSNGAVGYAPAFRAEIPVGKDIQYSIARALESYDNDGGYAALRQRFESAQTSWASVREVLSLYNTVRNLGDRGEPGIEDLLKGLRACAGDLNAIYGLANMEAMSNKRQRVLPARCRVYDLINYASEAATHHVGGYSSTRLQAYIGQLITDEYDMEGTAKDVGDYRDFFMAGPEPGPAPSVN